VNARQQPAQGADHLVLGFARQRSPVLDIEPVQLTQRTPTHAQHRLCVGGRKPVGTDHQPIHVYACRIQSAEQIEAFAVVAYHADRDHLDAHRTKVISHRASRTRAGPHLNHLVRVEPSF